MNNLVESAYALRNLWRYINCKFNLYNIKYLMLPIIYLFVILIVVPEPNTIINSITHTTQDTYQTIVISPEEKVKYILNEYNLTENQFKTVVGVVLSEAESNSYEDAYAVINTIYNRTISKNWVRSINNRYGKGKGENLYYQVISPNQFTVYQHGLYKRHMNNTDSEGYKAIIDFLYTKEVKHNYLSFRANHVNVREYETFSDNGNKYFNILIDENRI